MKICWQILVGQATVWSIYRLIMMRLYVCVYARVGGEYSHFTFFNILHSLIKQIITHVLSTFVIQKSYTVNNVYKEESSVKNAENRRISQNIVRSFR